MTAFAFPPARWPSASKQKKKKKKKKKEGLRVRFSNAPAGWPIGRRAVYNGRKA
jgi:hypothetical protein